jgi:hypothetical protein
VHRRLIWLATASILFVTVGLCLAATFAPTGRLEDECGSWARPSPHADVREALVADTADDLPDYDSERVPTATFIEVPATVIKEYCGAEHDLRRSATLIALGVGVLGLLELWIVSRRVRAR